MRILNMGSLNNDYVYTVDHMVMEGETLAATNLENFCGGKGLNQSIALANAGIEVHHAGLIGEDGDLLLETCKKYNVNTTLIKKTKGKSGHAIIQVDKNAKNSILLYGGSNRKISKTFVDEVLRHFESGDMLLLQNEISLMNYIVESAFEKGMTIVLNPSPFDEHLDSVDMSKISIFLMNEVEGAQIAGTEQAEEILETMKAKYPQAKVVLTLGGEGAVYQDGERLYHQKVNVKPLA